MVGEIWFFGERRERKVRGGGWLDGRDDGGETYIGKYRRFDKISSSSSFFTCFKCSSTHFHFRTFSFPHFNKIEDFFILCLRDLWALKRCFVKRMTDRRRGFGIFDEFFHELVVDGFFHVDSCGCCTDFSLVE